MGSVDDFCINVNEVGDKGLCALANACMLLPFSGSVSACFEARVCFQDKLKEKLAMLRVALHDLSHESISRFSFFG